MNEAERSDFLLGHIHGLACILKGVFPALSRAQQAGVAQRLQVTWDLAVSREVSDHYFQGLQEMGRDVAAWTPSQGE